MIKSTSQNYASLSNEDRLNLSLAAIANDDPAELKILQDSCPEYTYSSPDINYFVPFQAIIFLSMVFSETCILYYHTVQLKEACLAGFEMAARKHKAKILPETLQFVQAVITENLLNLKAQYEGCQQFCNQLNINFADVLAINKLKEKCPHLDDYLSNGEVAPLAAIEAAKENFIHLFNSYRGILHVYH